MAFDCPSCGERIESAADPSQGSSQQYVEDCQVCCRPNLLTILFNEDGRVEASTEPETD